MVTTSLKKTTIDTWDGRAGRAGYTVALCRVVAEFQSKTSAADDTSRATYRVYYVDSTVASACRQYAEQRRHRPVVASSAAPVQPCEQPPTAHLDAQHFGACILHRESTQLQPVIKCESDVGQALPDLENSWLTSGESASKSSDGWWL